ncbi:MAG: hypothetical protein M3Y45_08440, partial [Actinomycetota bacterium]|nr:hypothetical protein [Actinomycetota bacterium]
MSQSDRPDCPTLPYDHLPVTKTSHMSDPSPHTQDGVRAVRIALEGEVALGSEVLLVRDDPRPFALAGRWAGGGVLVGSEPERIAT